MEFLVISVVIFLIAQYRKRKKNKIRPNYYTPFRIDINKGQSRRHTKNYYRDEYGYSRFSDSGKLVHRYIAEKKLGRRLEYWEVVHHIDGNKYNNNPKNLFVCTQEEHDRIHRKNLEKYNSWYKPKEFCNN